MPKSMRLNCLSRVKKEWRGGKPSERSPQRAGTSFKYTQIHAPFPGVVVKLYRHLGDFASAGVPILSMYNPELLYVTANLEETRSGGVAPGNAVELHLDAFAEPFRGRVVWIDKIDPPPPPHSVRPNAAKRRLRRVHSRSCSRVGVR